MHRLCLRAVYKSSVDVDAGVGADTVWPCADLVNVMRLQHQLQSLQHIVDHERHAKVSLDNKRQSLESQINELTQ